MGKLIKVAFTDFEPGFTPEKSLIYRLLLQNYQVELSKEPDYVFFSNYGERHLRYDCIRIFCTREDVTPDFNFCDYAIGLDYITLGDRYFRFPGYYFDRECFAQMNDKTYFIPKDQWVDVPMPLWEVIHGMLDRQKIMEEEAKQASGQHEYPLSAVC